MSCWLFVKQRLQARMSSGMLPDKHRAFFTLNPFYFYNVTVFKSKTKRVEVES